MHLLNILVFLRIIRAQLDDAITIGYITWRTAVSINLFIIMDELLPLMFYILLLKLQLNECINMLQEMNCITYENINGILNITKHYYDCFKPLVF